MTNREYVKGDITCACGTVMSFVWYLESDPDKQDWDDAVCPECEKILIRAPIPHAKNNGWHQFEDKVPDASQRVWLHKTGKTSPNVEYGVQANLWYTTEGVEYTTEGVEEPSSEDYWMPFSFPPGPLATPRKAQVNELTLDSDWLQKCISATNRAQARVAYKDLYQHINHQLRGELFRGVKRTLTALLVHSVTMQPMLLIAGFRITWRDADRIENWDELLNQAAKALDSMGLESKKLLAGLFEKYDPDTTLRQDQAMIELSELSQELGLED